jgi:hypothetical protein
MLDNEQDNELSVEDVYVALGKYSEDERRLTQLLTLQSILTKTRNLHSSIITISKEISVQNQKIQDIQSKLLEIENNVSSVVTSVASVPSLSTDYLEPTKNSVNSILTSVELSANILKPLDRLVLKITILIALSIGIFGGIFWLHDHGFINITLLPKK